MRGDEENRVVGSLSATERTRLAALLQELTLNVG